MTKRKYTLIPDAPDGRDFIFKSTNKVLPESVDLRDKMSPVVNQGYLGSCVANAVASGLREHMMINAGETVTPMSRLYLYYKARELLGTIGHDSGAMLRDGLKVLNKTGCAPEMDFPYVESTYNNKPSDKAEADAASFKIDEYHRIFQPQEVKEALANGQPVVIGFRVFDSFESEAVAKTGIVPYPDMDHENFLGGHALLVVGYKQINGVTHFITRNSWGVEWGDKGYCYLPQRCFETYSVLDMWVAQLKLPVKPEDLTFHEAILQLVKENIFVDPVFWDAWEAKFKAGTLRNADCANVILAFKKIAAAEINEGR